MNKFSDFADIANNLDGEKVKIDSILNQEIQMVKYRISNSKYNDDKCLTIQFVMNNKRHVIFTGSKILLEQCEKYSDKMPFITTINKIDKYYTFT